MHARRFVLAVIVTAVAVARGAAQTPTLNLNWTGATSNTWQTSTNWSPNGTPGVGGNNVIGFNVPGAGNLTTVTATGAVNSLTINTLVFGPDADANVTVGRTNVTAAVGQFDRLRFNSTLTANGDAPAGTAVFVDAGSGGAHVLDHDIIVASGVAQGAGEPTKQIWVNNSAQPLTARGFIVAGGGATRAVEFQGGGTFVIDAALDKDTAGTNPTGTIQVLVNLTGTGLLRLTSNESQHNSLTILGGNGVLRVEANNALGLTGGGQGTRINGGSRTNRVEIARTGGGQDLTVPENFGLGGRTGLASALSVIDGNHTLTGNLVIEGAEGVEHNFHVAAGAAVTLTGNVTNAVGTGTATRFLNLQGGGSGTINGVISNTAVNDPTAVVKQDTGTWTLGGTNAYTGATTVAAGTLKLAGSGSFAASPAVVVSGGATLDVRTGTGGLGSGANFDAVGGRFALAAGQTLRGTGTVTGGVSVGTGAAVAAGPAGGGPGVLTVDATGSGVAFQAGSTLAVRVVGGSPGAGGSSTDSATDPTTNALLRVTAGTLAFDPATGVVIDGTGVDFVPGAAYSYRIATAQNAAALSGLDGVTQFEYIGFDATNGSLSTDGLGAVFVNFTPVPEPSLVLLGAAGGLVVFRRRRA